MTGGVAVVVQLAGQHRSRRIEPLRHAALGVAFPIVEIGRDPPALRILSGGQRHARRRADRRIDVEIREPDALGREPIDVLGLGALAAEAGQIDQPMSSMKT